MRITHLPKLFRHASQFAICLVLVAGASASLANAANRAQDLLTPQPRERSQPSSPLFALRAARHSSPFSVLKALILPLLEIRSPTQPGAQNS